MNIKNQNRVVINLNNKIQIGKGDFVIIAGSCTGEFDILY